MKTNNSKFIILGCIVAILLMIACIPSLLTAASTALNISALFLIVGVVYLCKVTISTIINEHKSENNNSDKAL